MHTPLPALAVSSALALFAMTPVWGQSAADVEAETTKTGLSGNLGLFSSYRFRGIDQTFGRPALQGGVDYLHPSGVYVGNWNSNINSGAGYPGGHLEMDFYGGYKTTVGDVGLDVGALYYYYPGSAGRQVGGNLRRPGRTGGGAVDNGEVYVAASWKFLSLKYSHAVTNYFAI